MAQISPLVLKDGQATPASHTFAPSTPQMGDQPALWTERNVSVRLGDKTITLRVSTNTNGTEKVKGMIALPETAQVEGKHTVVGINRFNFEFSTFAGSSVQGPKDLLAFAKELMASTVIKAAVEDKEVVY